MFKAAYSCPLRFAPAPPRPSSGLDQPGIMNAIASVPQHGAQVRPLPNHPRPLALSGTTTPTPNTEFKIHTSSRLVDSVEGTQGSRSSTYCPCQPMSGVPPPPSLPPGRPGHMALPLIPLHSSPPVSQIKQMYTSAYHSQSDQLPNINGRNPNSSVAQNPMSSRVKYSAIQGQRSPYVSPRR